MDHPIDLIIFDCDGVLVDSEPLAMRVLIAALRRQGIEITSESAYRDYLGRSMTSVAASIESSHGTSLSPSTHEAMRSELYALYREELRASPGLPEVFEKLATPFCVASSSSPERVRLSLELTGLLPWFEHHIYSATMVENGKPAPDLFLHAAKEMGADPHRCLVIEDSPAGILAAQSAGMHVFAYLGGGHVVPGGLEKLIQQLRPDVIFNNMHELPDRLGSLHMDNKAL
jgi:HAD superfamily hydrolase (TIGR01509 family)